MSRADRPLVAIREPLASVSVYGFSASAVLAVMLGLVAIPFVFIPYVAWSFRTGRTGPGRAFITAAGVLYFMALWTYTIFPLPDLEQLVCDGSLRAQFVPFQFIREMDASRLASIVGDAGLRLTVLNVALFAPLGIFLRHLFQWRAWTCVAAGFGL